jgi:hypothetical protein
MYIEEGHEDTDLCGLSVEEPFLPAAINLQDTAIGRRNHHPFRRRGGSARIPEKIDKEQGKKGKPDREIWPSHHD